MESTADARAALFSVIGRQHGQYPPLVRSQYPAGQGISAPAPPTRNPFNAKGRTIYSADAHTTGEQKKRHSPSGQHQGADKYYFSNPATPPRGGNETDSEPSSSPSPSEPGAGSEQDQEMFDMAAVQTLLLPKPDLDSNKGKGRAKQDQATSPTSFLPPVPDDDPLVSDHYSMTDSYASSRNGDASYNGVPNGSSPSLAQTAQSSPMTSVIRKKLMGFVGFSNLPNQVHRKSVRKGFQFTAMVVGESGLGKSTLINTLFNTTLYPPKEPLPPAADRPKTVAIESIGADIEENGVRLHLTVVDTPGFGDFVNNDDSWKPIVENIESRFDSYLEQENRVNRSKIVDNRVHACLYFIQPTGHSLKQIDIEFMRRLHTRVNLIPVIAKADTMTDEEIIEFKQRILADIQHHNIHIFQAPTYENEDEETLAEAAEIASKIPFAVVGSNQVVETPDGRQVRGRVYPWGVVEVDNEEHCDFVKLRQMLVRTYMEELREYTNDVLYENWRTEKLVSMGVIQDPAVFKETNPAARMQEERVLHEAKLAKMEAEMKMVFQQKVQEKEAKLKQSEEELYARHKEMKETLEKQRGELEEKKRRIEQGRPLTPDGKSGTGRKKGFLQRT